MRTETDFPRNKLTIEGIQDRFGVSTASAYRLTKKKGWEYVSQVLEGGGRRKVFLVPEQDIPGRKKPKKAKKAASVAVVKAEPAPAPAICEQADDLPD